MVVGLGVAAISRIIGEKILMRLMGMQRCRKGKLEGKATCTLMFKCRGELHMAMLRTSICTLVGDRSSKLYQT